MVTTHAVIGAAAAPAHEHSLVFARKRVAVEAEGPIWYFNLDTTTPTPFGIVHKFILYLGRRRWWWWWCRVACVAVADAVAGFGRGFPCRFLDTQFDTGRWLDIFRPLWRVGGSSASGGLDSVCVLVTSSASAFHCASDDLTHYQRTGYCG